MTEESPFDSKVSYLPTMTRLLPQSPDAEQGVLSSFLLNPQAVGGLCAEKGISTAHFHIPSHGEIYGELLVMWGENVAIDFLILTQRLRDTNRLDQVGGAAFVTSLFTFLPTAANVGYYIDILIEKYTLREIIKTCTEYAARSYDEQDQGSVFLSELGGQIAKISTKASSRPRRTLRQAIKEKVERMQTGADDANVIPTGLTKLDAISPLRLGDLVLVTGERKAGKSILALSITEHVVLALKKWAITFSLEDPEHRLVDRLVAGAARIPINRHTKDKLTEGDWQRLVPAMGRLADAPIVVRDDVYDLDAIGAVLRQFKTEHPDAALAVIDYAQLVNGGRTKDETRQEEVAKVSRRCRMLSMELNIAILLLCQLNKEGGTRESAALEQDCTAMWKIVREGEEETGKRWIAVPFQRNGESGVGFRVAFLGDIARVENLSESESDDPPTTKKKKTYNDYHQ